jgi:TRAP transporter TAXI family solute receptor
MLSRKAALGLSVLVVLQACSTRAAVDSTKLRPALRVSMRTTELLNAFVSLQQFSIQTVAIGNSEKRLDAIEKGSVDVASAVADITYLAFNGRLPGRSEPMQKIRGIALMNRAVVHVLLGPAVDPSRGFRGMRIVLGDPAGGNASLGERLVNSTGVATSDVHGEFAPYDIAVDELLQGRVDASIITGQPPQPPVARALRGGAHLRAIEGEEVDRLRAHYPLLRKTVVPRGAYPSQDAPLHTVGVDLLLVCRANLSNDVVYEITRSLFEEFPEQIRRQTDMLRAPATVIPLHAGAARYYRERELRR